MNAGLIPRMPGDLRISIDSKFKIKLTQALTCLDLSRDDYGPMKLKLSKKFVAESHNCQLFLFSLFIYALKKPVDYI